MSEQFGINRTFRNSATVDSNILSVLPPAILMNNLRKTFFSDSTFSGNQHRQIGRSYLNGNIYVAIDVFRNRQREKVARANPLRKQYYEKRDDSDKLKLDTVDED